MQAENPLSYHVILTGLDGGSFAPVRQTFNGASLLEESQADGLASVSNLRGHVTSDVDLLSRVLRSYGYYAADVSSSVSRINDHFSIEIVAAPGTQYQFGEIEFKFHQRNPEQAIVQRIRDEVALAAGGPALAAAFVAAEARMGAILPELGFPFAKRTRPDIVVDHQTKLLNVVFHLETGERQRIGRVRYKGLNTVKETYLLRLSTWQEGEFFKQSLVDSLQSRLLQTDLFSKVGIEIVPAVNNHADLLVTIVEAQHRTLGTTAGYSTAEGFGADVFWEHRNMFARGGVLKFTARGAEIEQSLSGRLELAHFGRLDQTLSFESLFRRQDTDAFLSYEAEVRAGLDRVVTKDLAVSAGTIVEYNDVTDAEGDRDFIIASLPLGARWDSSDDLLNPSRGVRVSLVTAPGVNLGSNGFSFLKSELRSSAYFSMLEDKDLILAFRSRIGSIIGPANETLPATQRFYAGGGGSIRGFSFQNVGPLDADNDPLGGRSVVEFAAELRLKVSSSVGIVPFIEGGNTYVNEFPRFSDFRWGAGVGARYYTSFGPVRFDLAFPLDRRMGESRFQFYVSLGQAF